MPTIAFLGRSLAFVVAALLLGCSTPPASDAPETPRSAAEIAASTVKPPFFRVAGRGGASLLLMGTIHLGPEAGWKFSPEIVEGMRDADSFILEIDLREATEEEVSTVLANRVVLPVGVTIDNVVSPTTAKLMEENEVLLTELGFPEKARRRLKPWFLAVAIIEAASRDSGYSGGESADSAILTALADRPLIGLETFDGQLAMFDSLSKGLQDAMLADTVGRLDEAVEDIEELVVAWARSDEDALTRIAYQGMDTLPELEDFYDILFAERNQSWVAQLDRILQDPALAGQTVFVGVGALHLVGPDSVLRMLASKGYRAEPMHEDTGAGS